MREYGNFEWPEGWSPVVDQPRSQLESELAREIGPGHPLQGSVWKIIARSDGTDDVLVQVERGELQFAEVHLTWSGERSASPNWPRATFYDSLAGWAVQAG
jgi:hypothetical protein